MQLTTQQIATIEQTLVLNGLVYDDIKLELLDHIASEIEAKMDAEHEAFETVFKAVLKKWKNVLQTTSNSWWLGAFLHAPQVAIDKLVAYSKKQMINVLLLSIAFATALSILGETIGIASFIDMLRVTVGGLFYAMVITTTVSGFLIWQSSFKTTFGRLFLYRGLVVFLFCYLTNIENQPLKQFDGNHTFATNFISCFVYGFLFFYSYFQITMAFKHFIIVSKLKKI